MTKRYTILQKKLQQIEYLLNEVLYLPPEKPRHQHLAHDVEQRFVFLKNLLSAEVASHPSKPHHLQHIRRRMTELETAFQEWDSFKTPQIETASTCSCTESCLNDDGTRDEDYPEEKLFFDGLVVEEKKRPALEIAETVKPEERIWVGNVSRRYFGAVASGVVAGVVLMGFAMATFSGCFEYLKQYDTCFAPT